MHNPLNNPDIDGNSLNLNKEDGQAHADTYECTACKCVVPESNWNERLLICNECLKAVNDGLL